MAAAARRILTLAAALLVAACANHGESARRAVAAIDAALAACSADAGQYVPDRLFEVETQLGALKGMLAQRDYGAVVAGPPPGRAAAPPRAAPAAAQKDAGRHARQAQGAARAGELPAYAAAVDRRLGTGAPPSGARSGLDQAAALWSKAQAAFAAGNLGDAVSAGRRSRSALEAVATSLDAAPVPRP